MMISSIVALLLSPRIASSLSGKTPRDDGTSACNLDLSGVSDWTILAEKQSLPDLLIVAKRPPGRMELIACAEAIYTEEGLDIVTEAQWTLILAVVVSPEGLIERFRIVHQPPIEIDLLAPTKEALRQWRYRPVMIEGAVHPICLTLALPKPLGLKASSACGTTRGKPQNQASAVGRELQLRSGPLSD